MNQLSKDAPESDRMSDNLIDWLRLHLTPGIGPRIMELLLERFETPREVLNASGAALLAVDGVGPKLSAEITKSRTSTAAEEEIALAEQLGVSLLLRTAPDYPTGLREICDAPPVLSMAGSYKPCDELAVAIVGSRQCTLYGRQQAEKLAGALARAGITIISGLARGIDACAHRGALQAGGRTIAVCATGLAEVYPPEHKDLAGEIRQNGCLISESPLRRGTMKGIFPQRNRLISGLSLGVIIVEASRSSGSLHTARHAMEQGREVFAVPGRIDSLASQGCHDLIRDGVTLVRSVEDILESLGPLIKPVQAQPGEIVHAPRELLLNDQEREVLNLVREDAQHLDEIVRHSSLDPARVIATLTVLEMKRLVRRLPGSLLVRAPW